MPEVINLTRIFVDQKISEIVQKSRHPYHSALFNLNLRKKLIVCILNQLKPRYAFFDRDNMSFHEISQEFSEHEKKRIERLISNAIIPVLQEANALKYFPCQPYSSIPQPDLSHRFG